MGAHEKFRTLIPSIQISTTEMSKSGVAEVITYEVLFS
jgi:hypothetical protein